MAVKIFTAAREQLLNIWDYTERTWGKAQADKYIRDLVNDIDRIQSEEFRWRVVPHKDLVGIWFFHHQHHFVFFRKLSTGDLGVISVLHENMDLPARLREAARFSRETGE